MTQQCNIEEILRQMKALDDLKDIRFGLGECQLGTALDALIKEQTVECERLTGECGNIDTASLFLPETDDFPLGESLDENLIPSLTAEVTDLE